MKNGYDQFFDKAKKTRGPKASVTKANKQPSPKADPTSAEQYLRAALHVREKSQRSRKNTPWTAIIMSLGIVSFAALGYFYPNKLESVLSEFNITLFSSVEAADGKANPAQAKAGGGDKNAAATDLATNVQCPEAKGYTEEELSHFNKLNERKKELDLREAELTSLEEELHKQKLEIETRISKLEQIRENVATVLKERVGIDEQRVATLVDFYSNMKPKQAAEIIATLNEDLAVEILGKMKKKNAADILNLLEPAKARTFSEKFTGYKRR
jgi:flagellar motility protein MotE (MotC chaperone)